MKLNLSLPTFTLCCTSFASGQPAPTGDYHQHLFSPGIAALLSPPAPGPAVNPIGAEDLIGLLDAAGIERAAVLSVAYIYGGPARAVEDEYAKVRAENDWTSGEVARYPNRLRGFCSFNPLEDYALEELARCARDPHLNYGLKLHFGNSAVDYHTTEHVARLKDVFRAANDYDMAIAVHMRASISQRLPYGRDAAQIFLDQLIPVALNVPIQIAHLAGAGGYADPLVDEALGVFVEAIERNDPRTRQLYFDVTGVAMPASTPAQLQLVAARVRELGVQRILYGSDAASGTNPRPRAAWAAFRSVPLTDAEFQTIASNVPPYMR